MTTQVSRRFSFGKSFINHEGCLILPEVEAAKTLGFEEGYQQGFDKCKSEIDAEMEAVLQRITGQMNQLLERQEESYQYITGATLLLVQDVAKKLMPTALDQKAEEEITQFVYETLKTINPQTTLTFMVHPDLLEGIKNKIEGALVKKSNLEIRVESDDQLHRYDCRAIWDDGGIEKFPHRILNEVDNMLKGAIENHSLPPRINPMEEKELIKGESDV